MSTQTPTIGRIVQYRLSDQDAEAINRRRHDAIYNPHARKADGSQTHVGNPVYAGDVFPLIITRVWEHGLPDSTPILVNGQVLLDGNDTYWATSVSEGNGERQYQWPYVGPKPGVVVELTAADREYLKQIPTGATVTVVSKEETA